MNKIDYTHYFDWAATAPFDTEILQESLESSFEFWANPSSIYKPAIQAKNALNDARARCAKILDVDEKTLFFTSGGTESDHIPLLSIINRQVKGTILLSAIEHSALREQCSILSRLGYNIITIEPDTNGIITAEAVISKLTPDTLFVTVMAVNNETGAINDVAKIAKAIKDVSQGKRKPKFHVDFVQGLAKIPVILKNTDIDSAAFSAHKIGGPRGIGLLYLANTNSFEPFLKGGGQEQNVRSGTENVFGAIAFSRCIEKYAITKNNEKTFNRFQEQKKYTQRFIEKLSSLSKCHIIPETRKDKNFSEEHFSPWVLQVAFDKIPGQVMVRALDEKGFCISTGSACSSRKNSRPILEAMKISPNLRENAVRFSFGHLTTENAMDELFEAVKQICQTFK